MDIWRCERTNYKKNAEEMWSLRLMLQIPMIAKVIQTIVWKRAVKG